MFNIGPMEFIVLAIVLLVVVGPERMPGLAKDAGRMLRTLREMATGARKTLREELGPELADIDLRSLHPRTAIQKALFEDMDDFNPRKFLTEDDKPSANGGPGTAQRRGTGEPAPHDDDAT